MVLDDDIIRKDEPINIDKNPDGLMAVAIDLGFPIIRSDKLNITIYAQAAKMLGKTQDPDTGDEEPLGIGLIPLEYPHGLGHSILYLNTDQYLKVNLNLAIGIGCMKLRE